MAGLLDTLNNPLMGLAAGLLSARAPGGTFGGGLSQGLNNMMGMQQAALSGGLLKAKLDEIEQAKKERENWAKAVGTPGINPTPYQMSDAELFPGEQPIQGLLNAGTPGTGMYQSDPGMAGLLSMVGPEQGKAFLANAALQQMKPVEAPADIQELMYYQKNPALFDLAVKLKQAGATSVNVGMDKPLSVDDLGKIVMPDGTRPPIGATGAQIAAAGGKVDPKLTESQSNATAFGMRAAEMDKTINNMISSGNYDPSSAGAAKDWLTSGNVATNWAASDEGQKYINTSRNFVAAVLRKESGATITKDEWDSGTQLYIPLPGDSDAVKKQKAENRRLAIKGMTTQAGPGAVSVPKFSTSPDPAGGGWSIEPAQ